MRLPRPRWQPGRKCLTTLGMSRKPTPATDNRNYIRFPMPTPTHQDALGTIGRDEDDLDLVRMLLRRSWGSLGSDRPPAGVYPQPATSEAAAPLPLTPQAPGPSESNPP